MDPTWNLNAPRTTTTAERSAIRRSPQAAMSRTPALRTAIATRTQTTNSGRMSGADAARRHRTAQRFDHVGGTALVTTTTGQRHAGYTIAGFLLPGRLGTWRSTSDRGVELDVVNSSEVLLRAARDDVDLGFVETTGKIDGLAWPASNSSAGRQDRAHGRPWRRHSTQSGPRPQKHRSSRGRPARCGGRVGRRRTCGSEPFDGGRRP